MWGIWSMNMPGRTGEQVRVTDRQRRLIADHALYHQCEAYFNKLKANGELTAVLRCALGWSSLFADKRCASRADPGRRRRCSLRSWRRR